ncbi:MAG: hypothetical protein WA892_04080 [Ornithinimicrobium sp.]
MTIYSRFDGLTGVSAALFDAGFAELGTRMHTVVPQGPPLTDVQQLGWVYRHFALIEQPWYGVMFHRALHLPYGHVSGSARDAFAHLAGMGAPEVTDHTAQTFDHALDLYASGLSTMADRGSP